MTEPKSISPSPCWGILHVEDNKWWSSDASRQFWGTPGAATRAFDRDASRTLSTDHRFELVELADIRINQYKGLLAQWLKIMDTGSDLTDAQQKLLTETKYVLGIDPRPVSI